MPLLGTKPIENSTQNNKPLLNSIRYMKSFTIQNLQKEKIDRVHAHNRNI